MAEGSGQQPCSTRPPGAEQRAGTGCHPGLGPGRWLCSWSTSRGAQGLPKKAKPGWCAELWLWLSSEQHRCPSLGNIDSDKSHFHPLAPSLGTRHASAEPWRGAELAAIIQLRTGARRLIFHPPEAQSWTSTDICAASYPCH